MHNLLSSVEKIKNKILKEFRVRPFMHRVGRTMRGGAAGSVEGTSCRICSKPDSLMTSTSRGTRACLQCMREERVYFADGSVKRFCYGHRVFEPIEQARSVVSYVGHTSSSQTKSSFFCTKTALCTLVFRLRQPPSHFSAPPSSDPSQSARVPSLRRRLDSSNIHE